MPADTDLAATCRPSLMTDILAHGVDKRGVLRQHYDTDALDASTLLAAIFGFLPPTTSGCAPACSPSPTS
jgi:alpha,alpha-trehalase